MTTMRLNSRIGPEGNWCYWALAKLRYLKILMTVFTLLSRMLALWAS